MWTLRQTDTGWELVDDIDDTVIRRGTFEALSAVVAAAAPPEQMHWEGVITVEGTETGDGRFTEPGAWTWETPFPLTWRIEDGGHYGRVVGTVWEVERRDDGTIFGRGTFDVNAPSTSEFPNGYGLEAARQVNDGLTTDVSIEPDSLDMEVRVRAEVVQDWEDELEALEDNEIETETDVPDEDGRIVLDEFRHDDFLEVVTAGRVRTLAIVTTAAFDEATIGMVDGVTLDSLLALRNGQPTEDEDVDDEAVVASAVDTVVPADQSWFTDPGLQAPTPLTITDDGRVYGHLATWDTCHIGRDDVCLTPPRTATGYAYFRTGEYVCESCDGARVPVGHITMDTGHASLSSQPRSAAAHYDNTGHVAADIAVGEDEHGVWVAGAVRPDVMGNPSRLAALRSSSLSGDWRRIGGNLELVAALAVNVPGFPIPRSLAASASDVLARAHVDHGVQTALVASGIVQPGTLTSVDGGIVETVESLQRWVARQRRKEAAELRERVAPVAEQRRRDRAAAVRERVNG